MYQTNVNICDWTLNKCLRWLQSIFCGKISFYHLQPKYPFLRRNPTATTTSATDGKVERHEMGLVEEERWNQALIILIIGGGSICESRTMLDEHPLLNKKTDDLLHRFLNRSKSSALFSFCNCFYYGLIKYHWTKRRSCSHPRCFHEWSFSYLISEKPSVKPSTGFGFCAQNTMLGQYMLENIMG